MAIRVSDDLPAVALRPRKSKLPHVSLVMENSSRKAFTRVVRRFRSRRDSPIIFWANVNKSPGCWSWKKAHNSNGIPISNTSWFGYSPAVRVAWQLLNGPIPEGDRFENRCGNRGCVRPDHWELMPSKTIRKALLAAATEKRRAARLAKRQAWFWQMVDKTGNCWEWLGLKNPKSDYGTTYVAGTDHEHSAHRIAWILTHGPIPKRMCVCHHCDNPGCVNPDHLFLGTFKDNIQDSIAKGRHIASPERRAELQRIRANQKRYRCSSAE